MVDERLQVDCSSCNGEGGPPDFWDDEICRWEKRICGSCGGRGWRWEYQD